MVAVVGFGGEIACSNANAQADGSVTPTPLCPTITPDPTPIGGLRGDVDCNGTVDASDALLALKIGVGVSPKPIPRDGCFQSGDLNCDNKIDSTDGIDILRLVLGLSGGPGQPTATPCGK